MKSYTLNAAYLYDNDEGVIEKEVHILAESDEDATLQCKPHLNDDCLGAHLLNDSNEIVSEWLSMP